MKSGPAVSKELYVLHHGGVLPVDKREVTPRVRCIFKYHQVAGMRTVLVTLCDIRSGALVLAMKFRPREQSSMPVSQVTTIASRAVGWAIHQSARAVHSIKDSRGRIWPWTNKTVQTVVKKRSRCSVLHRLR